VNLEKCGILFAGVVLVAVSVCSWAGDARAYDYRVPILVDDDDDLNELLASEDITEDQWDTLRDLLRNPLDLNKADRDELYDLPGLTYEMADRIIEYRKDNPFKRPTELKKIEGITDDVYVQLKKFVKVVKPKKVKVGKPKKRGFKGKVRVKVVDRIKEAGTSTTSKADEDLPEGYLQVKVEDPGTFEAGAAVMTRTTLGEVESIGDNLHNAPIVVDDEGLPKDSFALDKYYYIRTAGDTYLPAWPKLYGMTELGGVEMLAGSYRIGFGQRLVFDSTGRSNPAGFVPDLTVNEGYYGFSFYKGQFGAAATIPFGLTPDLGLEATPFFSWWRYDVNQYYIKHARSSLLGGCHKDNLEAGDPADPTCYEPYAILEPYGNTPGTYTYRYGESLPHSYSELIGGANVRLLFLGRSHVGVTGYVDKVDFALGDDLTVFKGNTPFPERDMFFAGGLDTALVFDPVSVYGEGAINDLGAPAGLVRAVSEVGDFVLEANVRYYSEDYDNPHAKSYNMSDLYDGSRLKGEMGGMLSVRYRPFKWFAARLDQDIWRSPAWKDKDTQEEKVFPWRAETYAKLDFVPVDKLRVGVFGVWADKDIEQQGSMEDDYYGTSGELPQGGKYQAGAQLSTRLIPNFGIWAYYKTSFYDVKSGADEGQDEFKREHYGVFKLSTRPLGFVDPKLQRWLQLDARAKYFEGGMLGEDMESVERERYVEGYVQLGTEIARTAFVSVRGAIRDYLEKKNSQGEMTDKPVEYFWKAVAEYRF